MTLIYCIILFVVGLVVYRFLDQYLLHYLLIWFCFGPIFLNVFYTIEQEDYYNILTWAIYFGYAIVLLECLPSLMVEKWHGIFLLCVLGLILYYVALSFLRGTDSIGSLKYITGNVGFLLSLSFILNKECDIHSLGRIIKIVVYFELFLSLLQPYTDLLNFHAALDGDDVMTSMVNGTFVRNNVYVEFITPLVMLLVYYDYQISQKILPQDILVTLVTIFVVYNSGVRTAFVGIIPILIYVFYIYLGCFFNTRHGRILAMLIFGICMYSVYSVIHNMADETGVTYTKNATDSSERQAVLLSLLNDPDFAEEQTTLGLSFVVLSTLPENPVFGSGKLLKGKGYGGFINKETGNITDATLAIFLCETGVIGLGLLLFIFYILLYKIEKPSPLPKLIFLYLFLITISDPGIFFMGNVLLLFIAIKISSIQTFFNNPEQ